MSAVDEPAREILETFHDGSRIMRDNTGAWKCNQSTTLEDAAGNVLHRGPEWRVRLAALRRGYES